MNNQNEISYPNISHMDTKLKQKKSSHKKLFFGIIGLIIVALVALIIGFIVVNRNNKINSRTFMIYMVGSNLESENGLGTVDLDGIDYNEMDNQNINVVLIAGGSKSWDNNYIDSSETSIYELTANGFEKVKQQNLQSMGSANVLSNFLTYVHKNYKTDQYDLIFWNHGGAILGSEFDELYDNAFLSLSDMKNALSNSPFNGRNKLETVMFSTCLNGSIEVADVFKDYAKYLVASEEVTIGTSIEGDLHFINEITTKDSSYDVAFKYINAYKNKINNYKDRYKAYYGKNNYIYSTYSIVDLSNVKKLETAVNDFFDDIDVTNNYNAIAKVRSNLYQYGYTNGGDPSYDMVDLYNLVDGLKDLSSSKAQKVLDCFENTVLYNYATNEKSRGMSIYFPYHADKDSKKYLLSLYNHFKSFQSYNTFISKFHSIQTTSSNSYTYRSNPVKVNNSDIESDFTLELSEEQKESYAKAAYIVFRDNKDGTFLPVYYGNEVTVNGNLLSARIQDRQLKITSNTNDFENILTLHETETTDEYIKYDTVVVLQNISEWNFDVARLSLVYDKSQNTIKAGSAILVEKGEYIPNTVAVDMNDYTSVAFGNYSYKILDGNGNYSENWESNGTYKGIEVDIGNFDFKLQNFDDGNDYYCVFKIWDTYNNAYYSQLVKMN